MDIMSIVGISVGVASLVLAFVLEGGHISSLFQYTAAMIVFGGTIGATIVAYSIEEVKNVPKLFKIAFTEKKHDVIGAIEKITTLADKARREGLLSLEEEIDGLENEFFKKGIQLVVDGTDPELTKNILETDIYAVSQRHKVGISMLESAGGYAPTMGIIGTVMGLVHVLSNLSDPGKLGPSIAVAFIATLYGVASANLLWLPLASKLRNKSKKEQLFNEIILEGVLSIQAGSNSTIIRDKLSCFLKHGNLKKEIEEQGEVAYEKA